MTYKGPRTHALNGPTAEQVRQQEHERKVVSDVLARHGLLPDENQMFTIRGGVWNARKQRGPWDQLAQDTDQEYRAHLARIENLERLLESYKAVLPDPRISDRLSEREGRDIDEAMEHLEALLRVEQATQQLWEPYRRPAKRPEKPRNAGAAEIHGVLTVLGVSTWDACGIIAEMFREAAIDDREHDKIARSLYDKLSR